MLSHSISAWSATWSVHDSHVISAWSATWSVHDQSRDQCMIIPTWVDLRIACLAASVVSDTLLDYNPSSSSVHGILKARKYWGGLPCLPPEDLSDPGIKPKSPVSPACRWILYPLSQLGSPVWGLNGFLYIKCWGQCLLHSHSKHYTGGSYYFVTNFSFLKGSSVVNLKSEISMTPAIAVFFLKYLIVISF